MQGQILTRTILAWDLTGSAQSLAYINLIVAVPMIFASMIGGAITDRVERRQLIIIGQSLITLNEIFILSLLLLDKLEFWHLLCTAFIAGCAFPFIMPARMAITVNVVGPERIQSAMAISSGAMNLSRVAGPAMAGLIIAQFSVVGAYIVSTLLYGSAVFCMLFVKRNTALQPEGGKKPLLADIIYGFQYIKRNKPVMVCPFWSSANVSCDALSKLVGHAGRTKLANRGNRSRYTNGCRWRWRRYRLSLDSQAR